MTNFKILKEARKSIKIGDYTSPTKFYLALLDYVANAYEKKCEEVEFYKHRDKRNAIR